MKLPLNIAVIVAALITLFSTAALSAEEAAKETSIRTSKELSGVELYPNVKRLEIEEVHAQYLAKTAIIIDARNSYEYGTIHIKDALNVSVSDSKFISKLNEIRATDKRPIIFYCNGLTCMKSFRAAKLAIDAQIKDVAVYPYGVLTWAKAHPEDAVLLNKPLDKNAIIKEEDYKAKKLSPMAFYEMREKLQDQAIVIDIRTLSEVSGVKIWPGIQYNVKQDNAAIKKYVEMARAGKKKLLVYDESGHQIRWLQYFLRNEGFDDYYFLDGGHENYMRMIDKDGQYVMSEYMRERMKAQTVGGQID